MISNHKQNTDSNELTIYDKTAASFSLKTWRISVNEDQNKLLKLLLNPIMPDDATILSTIAHEYHHWVSSFCSTYGLLINICRQEIANDAVTLVKILSATSKLKKPVIISLRENIEKYKSKDEIKELINHYISTRKLVDLFIGTRSSPYANFRVLFPELIEVFQKTKNRLSSNTKYSESVKDLKKTWTMAEKIEPLGIDEKLIFLIENKLASLTQEQVPELDLHIQIDEYERLNWPAFLEGHAKYFQRAFESVLRSSGKDNTERSTHEAMHGRKDYEEWKSIYSRIMRLMLHIMGQDYEYCEVGDILTLQALADLAINPSLDVDYFFPIEKHQTMQTLFPGQRFAWACHWAKNTKSIAKRVEECNYESGSLEAAYKGFISDCCSMLEWEPPWIQAERWLNRYSENLDSNKTGFYALDHFLEGCRLRLEQPLFFGIPSHSYYKRQTWFASLSYNLTTPAFASRDSFPLFYTNTKIDSIVLPQQLYSIQYEILDQLMLCSGPLEWENIFSTLGKDQAGIKAVLELVKKEFLSVGIDLEKIAI